MAVEVKMKSFGSGMGTASRDEREWESVTHFWRLPVISLKLILNDQSEAFSVATSTPYCCRWS